MAQPDEILGFWLDELSPEDWYTASDTLDETIRQRFLSTFEDTLAGRNGFWLTYPSGALAYIILTDQFSRNMFRDTARAFSADRWARAAAKSAIRHGWDLKIDPPARQFFYMPLMHSENLSDQDHCVRLVCERMDAEGSTLLHARAHREVIRRFGRFPFRNAALDRASTEAETAFMKEGGYGAIVRELEKLAA
ncbi:DUF924 family protein [Pseudaestuariivita atlantica]|uniref:Membrane protein n=1 Tax=Pseudaestuariivita atlantica TaxID=1317121 RepID=A0A0L1JUS3_9RHOB|nr:DUF924 family protein [Pseudaestuariivita atlantica]KNG95516.1 membrane protein [Pseudaestuariivita atlantica]